jgi:hypothetical protein
MAWTGSISAAASPSSRTREPASSRPDAEEGVQLIRAFRNIGNPKLRQAVIRFVEDLARLDEVEKTR